MKIQIFFIDDNNKKYGKQFTFNRNELPNISEYGQDKLLKCLYSLLSCLFRSIRKTTDIPCFMDTVRGFHGEIYNCKFSINQKRYDEMKNMRIYE